MSNEKPWWFPERSNEEDEELTGRKYSDTWDHLGDARDEYEKLADAYLALLENPDYQEAKERHWRELLESINDRCGRESLVYGMDAFGFDFLEGYECPLRPVEPSNDWSELYRDLGLKGGAND